MRAVAHVIQRISHEEDPRFGSSIAILDRHHADGRGVFQGLAANRDLVVRDDRNFFRNRRRSLLRRSGLAANLIGCDRRPGGWGRLLNRWWLTLPASLGVRGLYERQ